MNKRKKGQQKNKKSSPKIKYKVVENSVKQSKEDDIDDVDIGEILDEFESTRYKCQLCKKSYMKKEDLDNHLIRHDHLFKKCDHCHKAFNDDSSLAQHMNLEHNFKCNFWTTKPTRRFSRTSSMNVSYQFASRRPYKIL